MKFNATSRPRGAFASAGPIRTRGAAWGLMLLGWTTCVDGGSTYVFSRVGGDSVQATPAGRRELGGAVVGRVTDAAGVPISRAIVSIVPAAVNGFRAPRVLADDQGRFLFRQLPPGRYAVTASKYGWIDGGFGRRWWGGSSEAIELQADEQRTAVDVVLWKAAEISGRVLDEADQAIGHADVRVARIDYIAGYERAEFVDRVVTDERGVYRVSNLRPGKHIVVVPAAVLSVPAYGGAGDRRVIHRIRTIGAAPKGIVQPIIPTGVEKWIFEVPLTPPVIPPTRGPWNTYTTTFYPSGSDVRRADRLMLEPGDERRGVDVVMHVTETHEVSGQVKTHIGQASGYAVHLVAAEVADAPLVDVAAAVTDDEGRFRLLAVPNGRYLARVVRAPLPINGGLSLGVGRLGDSVRERVETLSTGGRPEASEPLLYAEQPVVVNGDAVDDVALALRAGISVSGSAKFEGDTAAASSRGGLRTLRVAVEPADGYSFGHVIPPTRFSEDGRFVAPSLPPGRYLIRISGSRPGWTFKGATYLGRDVSETPLDIVADIGQIVMNFTQRPTVIEGTVASLNGEAAAAVVVLFPVEPRGWQDFGRTSRRVRRREVDQTGHFRLVGIPPGRYCLVAVADTQAVDTNNPAVLGRLAPLAERVDIAESSTLRVALRVKLLQ